MAINVWRGCVFLLALFNPQLMNIYLKSLSFACSLLFYSCGQQQTTQHAEETSMTAREKHLCDSMKIDRSVLSELKKHTHEQAEPFHYSLSKMYKADHSVTELDPICLPGFVFKEEQSNTRRLIEELQEKFKQQGYYIFILEQNFGLGGKDVMAILKTTDQYEVLQSVKTDGTNYNISNDSLIRIIKILDKKYSLFLISASGDLCEFKIGKEPDSWLELAKEAYAICPDIVDQGTGSVEALADELKKHRSLYLWWD